MRLSQIIAEADDHVNYDGLDPNVIERLSEYKHHQQQWAVRELREGGDINSVFDALDYYVAKIGDNRFQNILKSKSPTPKNILSLSLDDIKAAQHDFEVRYNRLSRRERERLRSNVLLDTPDLKIVEFKKSGVDDVDTAKALAAAAQFTKWCVVDVETGNYYLNRGPVYLITYGAKYLCHIDTNQLMDIDDNPVRFNTLVCRIISQYIDDFYIFCSDTESKQYSDAIMKYPRLAYIHAFRVLRNRWPEAERHIIKDPYWAYLYAFNVIKGRWLEAEPTIMQDAESVVEYASFVLKHRWPLAEPTVLNSAYIGNYAASVIGGRWPEGEQRLLQRIKNDERSFADSLFSIGNAVDYVIRVCRKIGPFRWSQLEQMLLSSSADVASCMYLYTVSIGERWPEAEPTIMKKCEYAYLYARDVIGGRWPEAEQYITQNQEIYDDYIQMIRGKLADGSYMKPTKRIAQNDRGSLFSSIMKKISPKLYRLLYESKFSKKVSHEIITNHS